MIYSIIQTSITAIIISLLVCILLYVILYFSLKKLNRNNVKNGWFICASVITVPVVIVEMALLFGALSIKDSIITPAHLYASNLAISLDSLATDASSYVNGIIADQIDNLADLASDMAEEKIDSVKSSLTDNMVLAALGSDIIDSVGSTAQSGADILIDGTADAIQKEVSVQVDRILESVPTDIIAELKKRFPAISSFLEEHDLQGANNQELVEALFTRIRTTIDESALNRTRDIAICIITLVAIALLAGRKNTKNVNN